MKKRVFIGTTLNNSCIFYHTDLSLMKAATAKDTRNWMKEKGYEVMWILPEMDYSPATPSSNAIEIVHLGISRNFVILITV